MNTSVILNLVQHDAIAFLSKELIILLPGLAYSPLPSVSLLCLNLLVVHLIIESQDVGYDDKSNIIGWNICPWNVQIGSQ